MAKKAWEPPSKGARRVYDALKTLGAYTIIPEHHIGRRLKLDFFLPQLKWGIEVQGTQHDEFNAHFHGSRDGFEASRARDEMKREMCRGEGVLHIPLPYRDIMRAKSPQELLDIINQKVQEERQHGASEEADEW